MLEKLFDFSKSWFPNAQRGIAVLSVPWGYCESWIHVACLSRGLVSVNAPHALSIIKKESDPGKKLEQWIHLEGRQIQ